MNGSHEYILYSRTQQIPESEDFQSVRQILQREQYIQDFLPVIYSIIDRYSSSTVAFYGEVFGPGVIRKDPVYYGIERNIRIFDIRVNEEFLQPEGVYILMKDIPQYTAPILGFANSLEEAMEFDVRRNSQICGEDREGNIIEGVVIKPYTKVYKDHLGNIFYLKLKNLKYREEQVVVKEKKDTSSLLHLQKQIVDRYLNENRVNSAFSKYGIIQSKSEYGNYIRYISDDIQKDCDPDLLQDLSDQDIKTIFSLGRYISPYLTTALNI